MKREEISYKNYSKLLIKLSLLGISFIIVSCNKTDLVTDNPNNELDQLPQENGITIKTITYSPQITRSSGDGVNDLIGYGYNCLYATGDNPNGAANKVIDLKRFESGVGIDPITGEKKIFPKGTIEESMMHGDVTATEVFEKSKKEFKKSISAKGKLKLGFLPWGGIQFSAEYDSNFETKDEYSFYKMDIIRNVRRLYLSSSSIERLKYFLTDEFRYALKHASGKEIINDYGTHVLVDFVLGGKLSVVTSAIDHSDNKDELFKFSTKIFKIISASTASSISKSNYLKNTSLTILQAGGSEIQAVKRYIEEDGTINTDIFNYKEWIKSINKKTSVLVASDTKKMIGIWELVDDPKIKTKILAELEKRGSNLGIIGSKSGEIVTGKSTPMYKLQNEKTGELAKAPSDQGYKFPLYCQGEYGKEMSAIGFMSYLLSYRDFQPYQSAPASHDEKSWSLKFTPDGYITVLNKHLNKFLCTDYKFRTISEDDTNSRLWIPRYTLNMWDDDTIQ